jgi:hypothetical protein
MRPGVSALSRLLCRRVEESGLRLDRWAFGVNAEVELVPAIHIPAAPAYPAALEGPARRSAFAQMSDRPVERASPAGCFGAEEADGREAVAAAFFPFFNGSPRADVGGRYPALRQMMRPIVCQR